MERSDAVVMWQASLARPDLFEVIFERHHRRIWAYLARRGGRDWADEQAGELFVAASANRASYDPARGSVVGWLYGITANLTRRRLRRDAQADRIVGCAVDVASPIDDAVEALVGEQQLAHVRRAMAQLSHRDREAIVLFAWERLSYEAIAGVLE